MCVVQAGAYGGGSVLGGAVAHDKNPAAVEANLQAALSRVWVVRCAHTFEFAAACELLHRALGGPGHQDTAVVVLDSLGTFHFRDKHTEAGSGEGVTAALLAQRNLSRLVQDRACLVLAAKPALYKPRGTKVFFYKKIIWARSLWCCVFKPWW